MNLELPTAAPPTSPPPKEPVLATIVPPAASPWQFGLRAMLGLMAVCCVQFAVMSYLGVFWGLFAGMGLCLTALGILLFCAFLISSRSPLLSRFDYIAIRLVVAITLLFLGTILAGGGTAAWYVVSELRLSVMLETDLGMRSRAIQVYDDKGERSGLLIMSVTSGGIADRAGLRKNEVIYFDERTSEFYHRLAENRGKPVDLNVAIGPPSISLDKAPKRSVTVTLPP